MDMIIEFFRDTLDGPFYIVWVVVLVILIFACIGYLAEKGINKKKEKEKYATVNDTNNTEVVQDTVVSEPINNTSVESVPLEDIDVTTAVNESAVVQEVSPVSDNSSVVAPQVGNTSSVVYTPQPQVEQTVTPVSTVNNVDSSPVSEVDNNVVIPTINQDDNNKG